MANENRVQTRVPEYLKFVFRGLIGLRGKNESDVLAYALTQWAQDHQEELEALGLSETNYLESMRGPKAAVTPINQEQKGETDAAKRR